MNIKLQYLTLKIVPHYSECLFYAMLIHIFYLFRSHKIHDINKDIHNTNTNNNYNYISNKLCTPIMTFKNISKNQLTII